MAVDKYIDLLTSLYVQMEGNGIYGLLIATGGRELVTSERGFLGFGKMGLFSD